MQTYAQYTGRSFDDAVGSGKRFLALYPGDPDAAYAAYMVAMSYYSLIPDVTRDQERTEKALVALQEVVQRWPNSEYAQDAKFKIQVVRDQLAGSRDDSGPLLSAEAQLHCCDQPLQDGHQPVPDDATRSRKRWPASPRPIWRWASSTRRRRRARCWVTTSLTAAGTRTPTRCCSPRDWSRARKRAPGSARPSSPSAWADASPPGAGMRKGAHAARPSPFSVGEGRHSGG